jgi:hypothetical protein
VLQDAPEAMVLRAIGLWQQPAAVPVAASPSVAASALGGLRRLVATLVFDSLDHGALAGGRRGAVKGNRRGNRRRGILGVHGKAGQRG